MIPLWKGTGFMISRHPFGSTGHDSSRIIFGAAALSAVSQDEADSTMALVAENGINHIDTAASYGDAELRLAPWLKDHRKDVFLATKTGQRTRQAAHDEIRRSLERMQVDAVDLIQLHNLVDQDEWNTVFAAGGALEAVIEARDEGLVRFIGVTGHGVEVAARHAASLGQFAFDSVLLPYSYVMMQNPQYAADFAHLAATCAERGVAMQTIKAITRRPWPEGAVHETATWYDPLRDQDGIDKAVHWVLGNPQVFLNTVGDIHVLPLALDAAQRFTERPNEMQMEELVNRYDMTPLFT
jgi:predicted aldo/keto reductase-like oxidoreductase